MQGRRSSKRPPGAGQTPGTCLSFPNRCCLHAAHTADHAMFAPAFASWPRPFWHLKNDRSLSPWPAALFLHHRPPPLAAHGLNSLVHYVDCDPLVPDLAPGVHAARLDAAATLARPVPLHKRGRCWRQGGELGRPPQRGANRQTHGMAAGWQRLGWAGPAHLRSIDCCVVDPLPGAQSAIWAGEVGSRGHWTGAIGSGIALQQRGRWRWGPPRLGAGRGGHRRPGWRWARQGCRRNNLWRWR